MLDVHKALTNLRFEEVLITKTIFVNSKSKTSKIFLKFDNSNSNKRYHSISINRNSCYLR